MTRMTRRPVSSPSLPQHRIRIGAAGRAARRGDLERGSVSLQVVMFTPVLFFTVVMIVFAGRVAMAKQSFTQVAAAAARTASLARTDGQAQADATTAANAALASLDLHCDAPPVVTVSGSVTATVPGATVQASVTCQLSAEDAWVPFAAARTMTATAASPVDAWRGR